MAKRELIVSKDDKICTITMNRPEVMNAITEGMMTEFQEVLDDVSIDENIRIVIIEGSETFRPARTCFHSLAGMRRHGS